MFSSFLLKTSLVNCTVVFRDDPHGTEAPVRLGRAGRVQKVERGAKLTGQGVRQTDPVAVDVVYGVRIEPSRNHGAGGSRVQRKAPSPDSSGQRDFELVQSVVHQELSDDLGEEVKVIEVASLPTPRGSVTYVQPQGDKVELG